MGECETANTARGRDMAGLIEQNSRVSFSLRAQGSLMPQTDMSGISRVAPNLKVITFDWVINPSHDQAFITSLCNETKTSMFKTTAPTEVHIKEAMTLCESGQFIKIDSTEIITENYVPGYRKSLCSRNEIYIHQENDVLLQESVKDGLAEVQNGNVIKKVVLEDYLAQDIRKNILNLGGK